MLSEYQPYLGWFVDFIVFVVMIIAAYFGYKRSFRHSLIQLGLQLITMLIAYSITVLLLDKVVRFIPSSLSIGSLVPDNLYFLMGPYENEIIPFIVFIVLYLISFVIVKGFLFVFSSNYEWEAIIKKETIINKPIDGVLSSCVTILNTYTYVIVILVFLGFPIFNMISKNSISEKLIQHTPVFSMKINEVYSQYDVLTQVINTYGQYVDAIYDGNKINFDAVQQLVEADKIDPTYIESVYEQFIPMIANEDSYLSYFNSKVINEDEMRNHINLMAQYIRNGIISTEIFNLYYKELIHNGTYDKLMQDNVITTESLQLLIESKLLDSSNVEKLKEYL